MKNKSIRSNLFSSPEREELVRSCERKREELVKSCESIIKSGKVTKKVLSSLKAFCILEKYSFSQIRTRLLYERPLQILKDEQKGVS